MVGVVPSCFPYPSYEPLTRTAVIHTCRRMQDIFREHDNILVSVSGGSDSDCIVHLVCKYFPEHLHKIHFCFVNTGLEYAATKRHLSDLETLYNISISELRGLSVVTSCRRFGFPILSKYKSRALNLYIRGLPSGEKAIFHDTQNPFHAFVFTPNQQRLAIYLKEHQILVSDKCCTVSKKAPLYKYIKDYDIDLSVTGERSAEGGVRSVSHASCFEVHRDGLNKFMPLWWWSDTVKDNFKQCEGIRYSDCYEVYGMKRTGCVGCPYDLHLSRTLQTMFEFEPDLFNACIAVFGLSYQLMDDFNCRRSKCLPNFFQLPLF